MPGPLDGVPRGPLTAAWRLGGNDNIRGHKKSFRVLELPSQMTPCDGQLLGLEVGGFSLIVWYFLLSSVYVRSSWCYLKFF